MFKLSLGGVDDSIAAPPSLKNHVRLPNPPQGSLIQTRVFWEERGVMEMLYCNHHVTFRNHHGQVCGDRKGKFAVGSNEAK